MSNLPRTVGARIVFTNALDGWMVNANESVGGGLEEGSLFQTADGGVSWHQAETLWSRRSSSGRRVAPDWMNCFADMEG